MCWRYDQIMRKNLTISVFLLAIITILAHQFIPHHYHNDHICFELSFLSESHQTHENHGPHDACCTLNHQHDTSGSTTCNHIEFPVSFEYPCAKIPDQEHDTSGCCLLTEMLVYVPPSHREEMFCPVSHLNHHDLPRLYLSDTGVQQGFGLYAITLPFRQTPYINQYHPNNATHTPGLRAPPVC